MIISVNEMKALVREIANLQGKGCESWLERQETAARKRLKESGIEEQTLSVKDVISILENVNRWLKNDEEFEHPDTKEIESAIDHAIYYLSIIMQP